MGYVYHGLIGARRPSSAVVSWSLGLAFVSVCLGVPRKKEYHHAQLSPCITR